MQAYEDATFAEKEKTLKDNHKQKNVCKYLC
jgi:hypothetical protein